MAAVRGGGAESADGAGLRASRGGAESVEGRGSGRRGPVAEVARAGCQARNPTEGGMEAGSVADSLLSGACVLFTLGMFSTGLSDLRHMRMTRSVDSVQFLPFLTTDVNNLSWLSYGVLKGDSTLIVVNAVGAILQTLYILVYLHYCPRKRAVLLQTTALLGVLLLGYGYFWLLVPDLEARLQQLGLFCSVFTISMYLSPLTDLAKVIQTKSTHRLSFSLTIATLLTSASWTLYGFRLRDPYIMVPNVPGILTSFIRLWLFWKFPQEQDRNYRLLQT